MTISSYASDMLIRSAFLAGPNANIRDVSQHHGFSYFYLASPRQILSSLKIENEPRRVFEAVLHAHKERHSFLAVNQAMIVGQGQIHHRTDFDLPVDRHWPFLDLVHAKDARLRRIQDRCGHQRTVHAAIRDRKRAALHFFEAELSVAR